MVMTSVISDIRPSTIPCPSISTPFRHFAILALLLAPLEILQPHLLCGHGLWLPLFSIFLAFIPLFKFILARLVARHRHCMMGHHSSKARGDLGATAQISLPAFGVVFIWGSGLIFGWDFWTWTLLLPVLWEPSKAAV